MTNEERALWHKIEAFPLEQPEAILNFTSRLARENGWSLAKARKAITEYRRFLFLAMRAGHPVSPPDVVDQVWHLHLLYTRSYWRDLCHDVLGRPLHHEPTEGGLAESAKFRDWYAATLASYRRYFDEPPAEVWPPLEERDTPKREQWVDVSRHWLLPKPKFIRRMRPAVAMAVLTVIVIALLVPGCQENTSIFDLRGPDFLGFYCIGFVMALVASIVLEPLARGRIVHVTQKPTDIYEIAMLGGGGARVLDAVLTSLYVNEAISVRRDNNRGTFISKRPVRNNDTLHGMEQSVYNQLSSVSEVNLRDLRRSMASKMEQTQQKLVDEGLVLSPAKLLYVRWSVVAPFVLLLMIGVIKMFVGLSRVKPVFFLILLCIVTVLAIIIRVQRLNRRTATGDAVWNQIKSKPVPAVARGNASAAALAVAIAGVGALQAPGFYALHTSLQRPRQLVSSSTGCGSGCGTSCGGGGCGGGGCGGGGCGGCGGGGD